MSKVSGHLPFTFLRDKLLVPGALALIGVIVGWRFLTIPNEVTRALDTHKVEVRLAALETALEHALSDPATDADPSAYTGTSQLHLTILESVKERLDQIEVRLAAVERSYAGDNLDSKKMPNEVGRSLIESLQAHRYLPSKVDSPANSYATQNGQSAWGSAAVHRIGSASLDNQFFLTVGGQLSTDCRRTVCKVDWYLPDDISLPEDEYMQLIDQGRWEMMALAAQNADSVGQLETAFELNAARPRISLFFKKTAE